MERTDFLGKCSTFGNVKKAPTGQECTQPAYYVLKLIFNPRKSIFVLFSSANIISLTFLGFYSSKLAHKYSILAFTSKTLTQCKFSKQHHLSPDFNFFTFRTF